VNLLHDNIDFPQNPIEIQGTSVVLDAADAEMIAAAADSALAASTRRVYSSSWRHFSAWCQSRDYQPMPAAPVAVALYVVFRAQHVAPATVRRDAAAIGYYHRSHSLDNPVTSDGVRMVMAGVARQGQAGAQRQALGISMSDLAAIRATARRPRMGRGGRLEGAFQARDRGILDVALCTVMFDGLLRRSEAAQLRWADVRREDDGSGRMLVRYSKTDQVGEGKVLWISPAAILALSELAAIRPEDEPDDLIFRLSGRQISRRIAQACQAAGLGAGYSGHSLRVGAAQALAAANLSLAAIMENGRWQSARMPARYTRHAAAAQSAMAKLYAQGG